MEAVERQDANDIQSSLDDIEREVPVEKLGDQDRVLLKRARSLLKLLKESDGTQSSAYIICSCSRKVKSNFNIFLILIIVINVSQNTRYTGNRNGFMKIFPVSFKQ